MQLHRFQLEHWLATHEPHARYALGVSGVAAAPPEALPERRVEHDHDYGGIPGEPDVVEAVAAFSGRPTEEVLLTVGGTEANFLAFLAAVEPGKRVLVESPTYFPLKEVPRLLGARVEAFERSFENGFRVDVEALLERVDRDVAAVVLANPNNPTGQIVPHDDLRAIAEASEDNGAWLVVDEIFRDLALEPVERARSLGGNVVTTESLTKCYGLGGLRAGWILGPEAFVERAREGKALTSTSNPRITQHLTLQALGKRKELLDRAGRIVSANLGVLEPFLDDAGWDWVPSRAPPLAAPRIPVDDDEKFCEGLLRETGVLLVPGRYVGLSGHVRFCYGLEPEAFSAGVERLRAHVDAPGR